MRPSLASLALGALGVALAGRVELDFNSDWRFHLGALPGFTPSTPASAALFPIDLTGTFVHGLAAAAPGSEASAAACAAACAADYTCQAWQYCPRLLSPTQCDGAGAAAAPPPPGGTNCSFPVPLDDLQCSGLRGAAATTAAECAAACCGDPACSVWQWCGDSGACAAQGRNACWVGSLAGGCSAVQGWRSSARNVTLGPACQTGLLADYGPGNWQTSGVGAWVAAARLAPPAPPPQATGPAAVAYDDSAFEPLQLPHDYLARLAPTNVNATPHQNEHGSIPFSDAWYRKTFTVPANTTMARLYFDGAYRSAYVFLNGVLAAQHEEGYTGFSVWLHNVSGAPLALGSASNLIAVYLASTIYTYELWGYEGAGQRDVTLVLHDASCSIAPWGIVAGAEVAGAVSAPGGASGPLTADALVSPQVDVACEGGGGSVVVSVQVLSPSGAPVGAPSAIATALAPGGWARLAPPPVLLPGAALWHPASAPDAPRRPLYTLAVTLLDAATGAALDAASARFGVRLVVFDAAAGLTVNGFPLKLRGLSIHQGFAGTGAAVPPNIQAYRVQRVLELGANAWRCAHNPVDTPLLDELDARGVMVWEENRFLRAFPGHQGYLQDAADMVARDRNHPSIVMWSLCNENGCGETGGWEGAAAGALPGAGLAEAFTARIKALDATRPVTANAHDTLGQPGSILYALDVMGLTYAPQSLDAMHAARPLVPLLNGESASCQSSRGDSSAADVIACSAAAWSAADSRVWDAGAFAWSGFDYQGETSWPSVISYYGILDLCGFDKPVADFYKIWWGAAAGWPGAQTAVLASPAWGPPPPAAAAAAAGAATLDITASAAAEGAWLGLAVNGVAFGARQNVSRLGASTWRGVPYAPGNYTVSLYSNASGGEALGSFTSASAGPPAALAAVVDWAGSGAGGALRAGGRDAALVAVSVVDAAGALTGASGVNISFAVRGPGSILGLGSGDHQSHLPNQGLAWVGSFFGRARAVLRSGAAATGQPLVLTVSAPGLTPATVQLSVV